MAADYQGFPVFEITAAGIQTKLPGVNVLVRLDGEVSDVAESPLTTNADGEIVTGTIAAGSPGDIAHFRIEDHDGMSASEPQILT
jgi:hypothetical protein